MSCQRAYDIDLAAFLASPRADAFAAFRDHYPRCTACSAEVRAWTELDAQLRGPAAAHPEPAQLLAFSEGGLADGARTTVEGHLRGCPSCRDELQALDGFDPHAAGAPAPAPEPGPSLLDRLRGLLLQPAFAYGVALLLAAPTVYRLVEPGGPASTLAPTEPVPLQELQQDYAETARVERAQRQDRDDGPVAKRERDERIAVESKEQVAPAPPVPAAVAPAPTRAASQPEAKPMAASAGSATSGLRAKAAAKEAAAESFAARPSGAAMDSLADAEQAPREIAELNENRENLRALGYLVEGSPPPLATERLASGAWVVVVPLLAEQGEAEVRATSPSGRRTLTLRSGAGETVLRVTIPPGWHESGVWKIERSDGAHTSFYEVELP